MTVSDPHDPFPSTVFGGMAIGDYLLDLERFSSDPSFGGQIPTEPRDRYNVPAWSIHDESTRSLTVNSCPPDGVAPEVVREPERVPLPSPQVPVPLVSKYVDLVEVTLSDNIAQARGPASILSTSTTLETRKTFKVIKV